MTATSSPECTLTRLDAADGDAADVGRPVERRDEEPQRVVRPDVRRRHAVDERLEERAQVLAAILEVQRRPALPGRGVDGGEVQRLVVGAQVHEEVEHLVHDLVGTRVAPVDLVHDEDRPEPVLERLLDDEPRLRHGPLEGVDEEQRAVGHGEDPLHLAAEVRVAGGVDHVDLHDLAAHGPVADRAVLAEDRDPALPLQRVGVHDQAVLAAGELVELRLAEHARLVEQAVDQGGLAVVDVGDHGDVADAAGVHGVGSDSLCGASGAFRRRAPQDTVVAFPEASSVRAPPIW
jgi:hypothetical protein